MYNNIKKYCFAATVLMICLITINSVHADGVYKFLISPDSKYSDVVSLITDDYFVFRDNAKGTRGVCDKNGNLVVPAIYHDFFNYFDDGTVVVRIEGLYGLINLNGKLGKAGDILLPVQYYDICYIDDGRYLVRTKNEEWGIFDRKNKLVAGFMDKGVSIEDINDDYFHLGSVREKADQTLEAAGLLRAKLIRTGVQKKFGLVDKNLKIVIPFDFDNIEIFSADRFLVQLNGKQGVINRAGQVLLPIEYQNIRKMNDNTYAVYANKRGELISLDQKTPLIAAKYDLLLPISETHASAVLNGKTGLVDIDGNVVISFNYDEIRPGLDFLLAKKDGKYGLIDWNEQVLIPFDYLSMVFNTSDGSIFVTAPGNKSGVLNVRNEFIYPLTEYNPRMRIYNINDFISPETGQIISVFFNNVSSGSFIMDPPDPDISELTKFGDYHPKYGLMFSAKYKGKPVVIYFNAFISKQNTIIEFTIGKPAYTRNSVELQFDIPPYIEPTDGRTMVPIRFIAEGLGAKVEWDDSIKTDYISLGDKTLSITLGKPLPDGMGAAVIVNDRLFVPIRYVAEQFGASVDWNEAKRTVTIVSMKQD